MISEVRGDMRAGLPADGQVRCTPSSVECLYMYLCLLVVMRCGSVRVIPIVREL